MSELKSASFGAMIKAALGGDLIDGVQSTREGGRFALPLERAAVISAENITPGRSASSTASSGFAATPTRAQA